METRIGDDAKGTGMKSKNKTKSTETLAPSTYSQPFIDDAASTLRPAYEQSQSIMQQYLPQVQQGVDFYGDTMAGKYLDKENPYLESMIGDTNQSIADSVNSQFSGARFGSGYHTRTLADRIGQNENNLRYGNYATERGYQNDAAGRQASLIQGAVGLPQQAAGNYAGNINALLGRYATSNSTGTNTSSPGIGQLIGSLAQSGAMAFGSEPALKTNVVKVGEYPDGLGIYDFDYLPIEGRIAEFMPSGRQRGVMADEVESLRPWALGPVIEGYRTVNYGAL
jgi:hypothetical protein